jgi:hypothetical protein
LHLKQCGGYKGDEEGVLVHGEKMESFFYHLIPYITVFWYWGWEIGAAKVALNNDQILMRCLLWDLHPEFEKWLTVIEV